MMDNLNLIFNARRDRINAQLLFLPDIIWAVSAISIFLMLINIAICSCQNIRVNIFNSYLFVLSLCLVLIVTIDLDRPFAGNIRLSDEAFLLLYKRMLQNFGIHYLTDGHNLAFKEKSK